MTSKERQALDAFAATVRAHYGARLHDIFVFGSRARGEATADSDVDLAVLLNDENVDYWTEKFLLIDLSQDALLDADLIIQSFPVSTSEWSAPETHRNPRFILEIRRDAKSVRELI